MKPVIVYSSNIEDSAKMLAETMGVGAIEIKQLSENEVEDKLHFVVGREKGGKVPKIKGGFESFGNPSDYAVLNTEKARLLERLNASSIGFLNFDQVTEGFGHKSKYTGYVVDNSLVSLSGCVEKTKEELLINELTEEVARNLIERGFIADPTGIVVTHTDDIPKAVITVFDNAVEQIKTDLDIKIPLYAIKAREESGRVVFEKILLNPSLKRGNALTAIADAFTQITNTHIIMEDKDTIDRIFDTESIKSILNEISYQEYKAVFAAMSILKRFGIEEEVDS